jgi:hypothetical protein
MTYEDVTPTALSSGTCDLQLLELMTSEDVTPYPFFGSFCFSWLPGFLIVKYQ